MNLYLNQESIEPPAKKAKYQYLFNEIDRQGNKCLELDDPNTIRSLRVSTQLYSPYAPSVIEFLC